MQFPYTATMVLTTGLDEAERAVTEVEQLLLPHLRADTVKQISVGLYEALVNAVEHGNLGITSKEKEESLIHGTYRTLIESRLHDPAVAEKKVTLDIVITGKRLRCIVSDEGCGFKKRDLKKIITSKDAFREYGRGVLITKCYFDRVTFNRKGNVVTLVKRIKMMHP